MSRVNACLLIFSFKALNNVGWKLKHWLTKLDIAD